MYVYCVRACGPNELGTGYWRLLLCLGEVMGIVWDSEQPNLTVQTLNRWIYCCPSLLSAVVTTSAHSY